MRTCERVHEVRNSGFDKKQTHRREMRMKTLFMQVICATTILCLSSATFAADPACSACGPGANWINACDPGGPDNMDSTGEVGIYLADDCSDEPNSFVLAGPALVTRQGSGGTDTIATEITSMNLVGGGLTLLAGAGQGDITQASTGSIVENGGNNTIGNSSFDVFFEADVPGVGLVWNHTALNVMAAITCVPPRARYFHPKGQCIPLYNDPDVGQGVVVGYLGNARHTTFVPAVSDWGVVAMALLVLAAGTVVIRRWRRVPA